MNKLPLLLLGCLLGAATLTTCTPDCREQTCDCFSEYEDAIQLRFDLDSLNQGFRRADVRATYVVRFAPPGFATPLDTAREERQSSQDFYRYGIVLNTLFQPRNGNYGPVGYNYAVVLPAIGRRYQITDIELAGEERGSSCCRCYRNTRKRLTLDGTYLVAEDPSRGPAAVLRR
jgi:hypothetical protein